ncbi:hypothetical protein ACFX13_031846 [Malus domestica]
MTVLPMPFSIVPHHRRHKIVCKASSIITTHPPQTLFQRRLEAFTERAIDLETQIENKTKGLELTDEESRIVQDLSREIVSKFLEKPIQFLRSSDGDLEEKLKELQFLATILEESC